MWVSIFWGEKNGEIIALDYWLLTLLQVKADKYSAKACFQHHDSSPRTPTYNHKDASNSLVSSPWKSIQFGSTTTTYCYNPLGYLYFNLWLYEWSFWKKYEFCRSKLTLVIIYTRTLQLSFLTIIAYLIYKLEGNLLNYLRSSALAIQPALVVQMTCSSRI